MGCVFSTCGRGVSEPVPSVTISPLPSRQVEVAVPHLQGLSLADGAQGSSSRQDDVQDPNFIRAIQLSLAAEAQGSSSIQDDVQDPNFIRAIQRSIEDGAQVHLIKQDEAGVETTEIYFDNDSKEMVAVNVER